MSDERQHIRLDLSECASLEEAVFTTLGAASMCWENIDQAGAFDSTRARLIGDELVRIILARDTAPPTRAELIDGWMKRGAS